MSMSSRGTGGGRTPSAAWSRLKPVNLDPLEAMGLPSKGDNRLLNFKTQEQYYTKIVDRYMAFCSSAGRGDELLRRMNALSLQPQQPQNPTSMGPPPKPAPKQSSGLASSRWADEPSKPSSTISKPKPSIGAYALSQVQKPQLSPNNTPRASTTAPSCSTSSTSPSGTPLPNYDSSSRDLSLLTMSMRKLREGIVASHRIDSFSTQVYIFIIRLSILLRQWESYHPALSHLLFSIHPRRPLSKLELQEFASYLVLDLACRQGDLAEANRMRLRFGVRDEKVKRVLKAVVYDDYVGFWRLMRSVDGHSARVMEWAEEGMRMHALKCVGRAYFAVDRKFVEGMTNCGWEVLVQKYKVGWELKGEEVLIRKVKAK